MPALGQPEPRRGQRAKHGQPGQPGQVKHFFELARPDQPDQQHQPRQRQADQALGQNAQRAGRKAPARQGGVRPLAMHESQGKAPDGHADPGGHQHVVVHILAGQQERQAGAEHPDRAPGNGFARKPANAQVHGQQHQPGMQRRHQAHHPDMHAKRGHGSGLQPVQQRRLVKKRNAVQARNQPVTAVQHPAANLAVAALVGHGQGPPGRQHGQQQEKCGHGEPGFALFDHAGKFICTPRQTWVLARASACVKVSLAR